MIRVLLFFLAGLFSLISPVASCNVLTVWIGDKEIRDNDDNDLNKDDHIIEVRFGSGIYIDDPQGPSINGHNVRGIIAEYFSPPDYAILFLRSFLVERDSPNGNTLDVRVKSSDFEPIGPWAKAQLSGSFWSVFPFWNEKVSMLGYNNIQSIGTELKADASLPKDGKSFNLANIVEDGSPTSLGMRLVFDVPNKKEKGDAVFLNLPRVMAARTQEIVEEAIIPILPIGRGGGNLVGGNCRDNVSINSPPDCLVSLLCREWIPPCCSASLSITSFQLTNFGQGACDVQVTASTHEFSGRAKYAKATLNGHFGHRDNIVDRIEVTEAIAVGGGSIVPPHSLKAEGKTGNGRTNFHKKTPEVKLTPNSSVKITMALDMSLSGNSEIIHLPGSADADIWGDLLANLNSFEATILSEGVHLVWVSDTEGDNAGFRVWRGIDDENNEEYQGISTLGEFPNNKLTAIPVANGLSKLIAAKGNEREKTTYSYVDISAQKKNVTFYYLLEDVDTNGQRTLHCSNIQAVTIGQGPAIDLEKAENYCRSQCDENAGNMIICK
ncbi:hypothetical protein THII_0343 [Thioploca ingrica]|uniref:Secreted protein n=1 Tax=Thioploca ingrica TaxID=40754 RepID=A0A090AII7_9GAMM|nr:hypothetical protein THII_0343 [Thioploca ingrica]